MWFYGEHWGKFRVVPGMCERKDGRPRIYCKHENGFAFLITFERWLLERRSGGIVPCP